MSLSRQMLDWTVDLLCVLGEERLCCSHTSLTRPLDGGRVGHFAIMENRELPTPTCLAFVRETAKGEGSDDPYSRLL